MAACRVYNTACGPRARSSLRCCSPRWPDWRGTGVVVAILPPPSSLHATRPVIIIRHDPIRGLMNETMDMPFLAASTDLFGDLRTGDRVAFGLKDVPGALLVVAIERLGAPAAGRAR